ncbi:hypothetical protein JF539_10395 [Labrenzia aggregata]|uniref:DUF296 domain-containing protein n=1 Tax=Roseibium aggregatum TaxID=187304 RepID=A0A939EDV9_9HYPH|nr:hypothetical protein [Roseibium aggregatum]
MLDALGSWAGRNGYSSAVFDLTGLELGPFDYVMPDRATDDRHVAWYSDTRSSGGACMSDGVAILGHRNGHWFAHIHAFWEDAGTGHLAHLLPDTLVASTCSRISGYGLKGAKFEVAPDPETEFSLFRVKPDAASWTGGEPNALIATLAPFEDLQRSVEDLSSKLNADTCAVYGVGSLAGARFAEAPPMTALISEIFVNSPDLPKKGRVSNLPVRAVDLDGGLHEGRILAGEGPTLITCELLLIRTVAPA